MGADERRGVRGAAALQQNSFQGATATLEVSGRRSPAVYYRDPHVFGLPTSRLQRAAARWSRARGTASVGSTAAYPRTLRVGDVGRGGGGQRRHHGPGAVARLGNPVISPRGTDRRPRSGLAARRRDEGVDAVDHDLRVVPDLCGETLVRRCLGNTNNARRAPQRPSSRKASWTVPSNNRTCAASLFPAGRR